MGWIAIDRPPANEGQYGPWTQLEPTEPCSEDDPANICGESGELVCKLCRPGTYGVGTGECTSMHRCLPCPKNTFQNMYGQSQCKDCADGKSTEGTGATTCT